MTLQDLQCALKSEDYLCFVKGKTVYLQWVGASSEESNTDSTPAESAFVFGNLENPSLMEPDPFWEGLAPRG